MKSFLKLLSEINAGALVDHLGDEMAEVVKSCMATGKKGEIRLVLKIAPAKGGRTLTVDPDVKTKVPEFDQATEYYFALNSGELSRNDPQQQQLPLRDVKVDPETGEIRETAAA